MMRGGAKQAVLSHDFREQQTEIPLHVHSLATPVSPPAPVSSRPNTCASEKALRWRLPEQCTAAAAERL
jgi:hypothetical protein